MTYIPHLRVVALGRLGETFAGAPEVWTFSTKWGLVDPDADASLSLLDLSQSTMDLLAIDALAAITPLIQEDNLFPDNVWLEGVKVYAIGADGTSGDRPIGSLYNDGTINGDAAFGYKPFQDSLAVSLVGAGRGNGKYGRFYLPPIASGVQPDGLIGTATAESFLSAVVDMLDAIDASFETTLDSGPFIPDPFSSDVELITASGKGAGLNRPTREIRVGRVIDTQRRRRNQEEEGYVTEPYGV